MLEIIFVSDYICPYCLVGKEALRLALEETGIEAKVLFQPVELTPESEPRVDTYHDPVRRERYERILTKECLKALGLESMKIPPKVIPRPYTRLAYEGWLVAEQYNKAEEYNDLVYRAYFIEEQDIGELEVLASIAERAGIWKEQFIEKIKSGELTARQKEIAARGKEQFQIKTLPTLIINGKEFGLKDFSREEVISILLNEASIEERVESQAGGCSVNGCG